MTNNKHFSRLWALIGGRGPKRLKVPVNAESKPALEGLLALVDFRMNRAPVRGQGNWRRKKKEFAELVQRLTA